MIISRDFFQFVQNSTSSVEKYQSVKLDAQPLG